MRIKKYKKFLISRHHQLHNKNLIILSLSLVFILFSDEIKLKLQKYSGYETSETTYNNNNNNNDDIEDTVAAATASLNNTESIDLEFTKNETIHVAGRTFQLLCGHIMETEGLTEEEQAMRQEEDACVLWNHVPEELTLSKMASSISYKFVMAVDGEEADVRQEIVDGKMYM